MADTQGNTSWGFNLFGFDITRNKDKEEKNISPSFVAQTTEDGAVIVQTGSYYGTYIDQEGAVRNEVELITKYREMALQPEIESAINDIVNEAIVSDDFGKIVSLNLDELDQPESIKKKIMGEFDDILRLLNFNNYGYEIFRNWYIDGRLFYHILINEKQKNKGIYEVRYIDPRRIRKIREIKKGRDQRTGLEIITNTREYYVYNQSGVLNSSAPTLGARIEKDSIIYTTSGLMDAKKSMVLSYLHKAIKPLNQVRMLEDAAVIYRLARAPERRVFYVDVGNMSTIKAEQYLKNVMTNYRNKLVYDSATGEIKNDRKFMTMLEDIFMPRREGTRSSEIETLPGGANLGETGDLEYFDKKLYKSLGIPYSRTQQGTGFSLGRSTEITRDELNFTKLIKHLRNKFSTLFDDLLRVQLVLKNICSEDEWELFKEKIFYDFTKDNNFDELKEAELNQNRLNLMMLAVPYTGTYFSKEWIWKNVLRMTEEDINRMKEQMAEDAKLNEPIPDGANQYVPEIGNNDSSNPSQTTTTTTTQEPVQEPEPVKEPVTVNPTQST